MRNAILKTIGWPFYVAANVLFRAGELFDKFTYWLDGHRKHSPKHRLSEGWVPEFWPSDEPAPVRCPLCLDAEFPVVLYDGRMMCLVCRDDLLLSGRLLEVLP